jgi:hypothetical protein
MLAIWVKVRVKPDQKKRFLEAIEVDALGSEKDEPGCLRFNVLQDEQDENVYYFYEVYKTRRRWRLTARRRTIRCGERRRIASMARPRRRAASPYSRPSARTGARCSE